MKFLNANTIHNILNVIIAADAGLTAYLLATGCITLPTGTLSCAGSSINPTYTAIAIGVLSVTKTIMNIARDGVTGLVAPQPPVQK